MPQAYRYRNYVIDSFNGPAAAACRGGEGRAVVQPARHAEPSRRISDFYARRFDIEELYRDAKCGQFAYALSQTRITRPDRIDRLLRILVLAYFLLVGLGLWAKRNLPPRRWASNNRRNECSAFTVGRLLIDQRPTGRKRILIQFLAAIRTLG